MGVDLGPVIASPAFLPAVASLLTAFLLKWLDSRGVLRKIAVDEATAIRAELRQENMKLRDRIDAEEKISEGWRVRYTEIAEELNRQRVNQAALEAELERQGIKLSEALQLAGARRKSDAPRTPPAEGPMP